MKGSGPARLGQTRSSGTSGCLTWLGPAPGHRAAVVRVATGCRAADHGALAEAERKLKTRTLPVLFNPVSILTDACMS
ncbi:hypothetical protein JOB18_005147 [Solea senegalensis]|uniref:Uncharacterized protein n=1 Tax=Solea senegalensis TaxID=28829 RepID=A0AAV6R9I2_SOLSE|nr:hypothetical protein JOB18_005147 [Solea senegalensis]